MCIQAIINLFKKKELKPSGELDIATVISIIKTKMDKYGDTEYEVYLPDNLMQKLYTHSEVVDILEFDKTNTIRYQPDLYDCDDFATELFGKGFGLVWTNVHAFNWFIDKDTHELYFIEPQNDTIAPDIASWQGRDVRFFLGR
jgi:hypothetical protein